MDVTFVDNRESNRYEMRVEGELVGVAAYDVDAGAISHVHTEVIDAYAGRGLAQRLVRHALGDARERGLRVLPYCTFVAHVIRQNPDEFLDLVPDDQRVRFGL